MFNPALENQFVFFGTAHVMAIIAVGLIVWMVIRYQNILKSERYYNKVRYGLAGFIILQEITLNVVRIIFGEWTLAQSLPIHLCGLAVVSTAYVLISSNKKYFYNTFFIMMIGAALAVLTPAVDRNAGFPHFKFIQFFISHGFIVINITFILFVMDFKNDMRYRYLLNNFYALIIFSAFAFVVNLAVGGNYMFLMRKPDADTAMDLFGPHPWYILNILIFGVPVFFHLFYLPFFIRDLRIKKRRLLEST